MIQQLVAGFNVINNMGPHRVVAFFLKKVISPDFAG